MNWTEDFEKVEERFVKEIRRSVEKNSFLRKLSIKLIERMPQLVQDISAKQRYKTHYILLGKTFDT